eukprot:CAMPEP_0196817170 /NCGR_PEP_ID=MMETSP1362-20130617/59134_1 /TAXON_ID=163516 /ORGANISM="Leptocylindrus danicus, Strain CCMP1856" /LENGTH=199 /DNA_ID=CAMNT_0042194759 /DNA_START=408 /DNA_END=1007 /DNA_ORIENTATION=-
MTTTAMLIMTMLYPQVQSFIPTTTVTSRIARATVTAAFQKRVSVSTAAASSESSSDVSDLGLTMEDLDAPLPPELLQNLASSGYESTTRNLDNADDRGCEWKENLDNLEVILSISGLRGQPAQCISVEFSTTTATVTAFGYVIWSCVLRGECVPESAKFNVVDGQDMVPVIQLTVDKKEKQRWGGFIAQVGENTISDLM